MPIESQSNARAVRLGVAENISRKKEIETKAILTSPAKDSSLIAPTLHSTVASPQARLLRTYYDTRWILSLVERQILQCIEPNFGASRSYLAAARKGRDGAGGAHMPRL